MTKTLMQNRNSKLTFRRYPASGVTLALRPEIKKLPPKIATQALVNKLGRLLDSEQRLVVEQFKSGAKSLKEAVLAIDDDWSRELQKIVISLAAVKDLHRADNYQPTDRTAELKTLAKLSCEQQKEVAKTIRQGHASNVGEALSMIRRVVTKLKISQIQRLDDLQPRVALDQAIVEEYAERRQAGDVFPDVVVFFDGVEYWLADGFYRCATEEHLGKTEIACVVLRGTKEDAQWHALQANKRHGQRLTNEDKQQAVMRALLHPKAARFSDRQIGDHVGVSHTTVSKYRAELVATGKLGQSTERVGRDGRTIDTSNIGNSDKAGGDAQLGATEDANEAGVESVSEHEADADKDCAVDDAGGPADEPGSQSQSEETTSIQESAVDRRKRFEGYYATLDKVEGARLSEKLKALNGALDAHAGKFLGDVLAIANKQGTKLSAKGACRASEVEAEFIAMGLMHRLQAASKGKEIVDVFAPKVNDE